MLMGETDDAWRSLSPPRSRIWPPISVRESVVLGAAPPTRCGSNVRLIVTIAVLGIVLALALARAAGAADQRVRSRALTAALSRLAEGDLTTPIAADDRADEIGAMTRAVIVLKQNTEEMRRLQAEQKEIEARARPREAQGGDAARLADELRGGGRQHRRHGVVGRRRARGRGRHADPDGRDDPAALRRRSPPRPSRPRQRAVGRLGDRGDDRPRSTRSAARCRSRAASPARR